MSQSFNHGDWMHRLASELFPICRSITGPGLRETLNILKRELPSLQITEVASGTRCFDWEVPQEWIIHDAYVADSQGNRIIDFKKNNLHVVNYSIPIDQEIGLDELDQHLFSLPDQPSAIPYITSYYNRIWGFCLSHHERKKLLPGRYRVKIASELKAGHLTYGELRIPGKSQNEILFSTYVCHPSMGNNELSGPVLATKLAKDLLARKDLQYSYRFVFVPETIGAIVYISKNLQELKQRTHAGFQVTCVGDEQGFSFLPSRLGNTLSDRAALHVLRTSNIPFRTYSFLDRGSDERQYCWPGVDLPVSSVMRSKYGDYPEYHTSLDDLNFITPKGLAESYEVYQQILDLLEWNGRYQSTCVCEPQLGKRGLYPKAGDPKESSRKARLLLHMLAYCDGQHDLIDVAEKLQAPVRDLIPALRDLLKHELLVSRA